MKKVLILAYDFPPYNSIGGQRPYSWYLYFKELGVEPIVVTRHWDVEINGPEDCYLPSKNREVSVERSELGTIVRAPFTPLLRDKLIGSTGAVSGILRKALTAWQMLTEHSISSSDSRHPIYLAANEYLKNNEVDMIMATGEPFILFTQAWRLSNEFNIPWIADYRDGWSTNLHLQEGMLQRLVQKHVHRPQELKTVSTASIVTTAAPSFAKEISDVLRGKKVDVIYNGYFEEKFAGLPTSTLKSTFTIAHAGTVYPYQKVETMINGLKLFFQLNPHTAINLNFYGLNFQPDQLERVRSISKALPVMFTDRMSHDKIIEELKTCHALLLLATPEKQQIYAKVFDYLALEKPILLVENDKGPLEKMLADQYNTWICERPEDVASALKQISSEPPAQDSAPSKNFSRRHQAERMAELLKRQ